MLSALGCEILGVNNLVLTIEGLPKIKGGVMAVSALDGPGASFLQLNGTWCAGRPLLVASVPPGPGGEITLPVDLGLPYGGAIIQPGETRTFQFLFHDFLNDSAPYTSNAVTVTFQ